MAFLCLITQCNQQANTQIKSQQIVSGNGTNIPVVDFEGFKPYLNLKNDTTYVLNFWATWCKPCIEELPYFERLNKEYASKKVKVILASLDFTGKTESHLLPYVLKKGLKCQVIHLDDTNTNTWIPMVNKNWEGSIPATLIYNKNHSQFYEQSFNYQELTDVVDTVLNF